MDDLSEKLASVLNDPESMERVRKMAENILGDKDEKPEPQTSALSDISSVLGANEMQSIIRIISQLKSSGNNPRTQLLNALKPHLSEPKREKVDTAIKILKVIEILPFLRESGIFNI